MIMIAKLMNITLMTIGHMVDISNYIVMNQLTTEETTLLIIWVKIQGTGDAMIVDFGNFQSQQFLGFILDRHRRLGNSHGSSK